LAAGVGVRTLTSGAFAKYAGIVLYAVMVYWLVLACVPRWTAWRAAVAALGMCWAIELLQLTTLPARVNAVVPLARWVLGQSFSAYDLVGYAAGVGVAAGSVHMIVRHRATKP
jgi:hypothetical protein